MASIYLVRRGGMWLTVWEHGRDPQFASSTDGAHVFRESFDAMAAADIAGGEVVEFREVAGDTAAGALAAAEATIARLRQDLAMLRKELEQLCSQQSTHEAANKSQESTDD